MTSGMKSAPQWGTPWWVISAQQMYVQNMPISPWAKLTIPVARWIRTSARARVAYVPPFARPTTMYWKNSVISVAEVGGSDAFVLGQLVARAVHRHLPDLEHVGVLG